MREEFTTRTHLIVQVLDTKAFPQVSEDLRTVFLEFEMSWKIFSVEDSEMKVRKRRKSRRLCLLEDQVLLLVEEVVVDFDLAVGLEVVGQQHDRNRDLV